MGVCLKTITRIETVSETGFERYKINAGGQLGGEEVPALLARGVPILLERFLHRFRARLDHFALHREEDSADQPVVWRQRPDLERDRVVY